MRNRHRNRHGHAHRHGYGHGHEQLEWELNKKQKALKALRIKNDLKQRSFTKVTL